ncbi:MAG: hypothetical protein WDN27_05665 [Candidatus Saccharibacteria bacterium]
MRYRYPATPWPPLGQPVLVVPTVQLPTVPLTTKPVGKVMATLATVPAVAGRAQAMPLVNELVCMVSKRTCTSYGVAWACWASSIGARLLMSATTTVLPR